ncbi:chromosome segregation protein SMC [Salinibacterium xinjiangense]|uniref:Predicted ATP-dependent endonuclease of the OLD family, contains P-loop ATPase and TOPRIM domains n=1 Tax=Salinibacterium xinjiangense TaxID=386302 RepID=A0A2C8ZVR8_9MICO|nr:AAA family ATPase [Salinibacterium xinjiangense]GGL02789.1 chromosome segregation protein SMC [Salinibacterium xinjiangense]SOE69915.1 Predicted ATP-dependent endonuclease of the OLD family, contains P-loop ATPase and TOPRIM domains [Salinibacterium xinjiangense]
MRIESVTLRNFQAFGPEPVTIALATDLTALIGTNGTGKTSACRALQRVFGVTNDERTVRVDDFHVAEGDEEATTRELQLEVMLSFRELDSDAQAVGVPEFFRRMAAEEDGHLKCRVVLQSTWTQDGTVDGAIETRILAVSVLRGPFDATHSHVLLASERSRVQVIYVPAARDGARQFASFLRGRLWNAARWSEALREKVSAASTDLDAAFHAEPPLQEIENALTRRWASLHGSGVHSQPRFRPIAPDFEQFLRNTELTFSPDHTTASRPATALSDGQRSLLHLSLVSSALELEASVGAPGSQLPFDAESAYLPALTIVLVEEPENSLAPFYLSRIVQELLELGQSARGQVVISSHSAAALTRVDPAKVRHFRTDGGSARVRALTLPVAADDAATYLREAVQAHPEIYFAKYVVLGEGASEEIVLPIIARAIGVDFDPAFIAMVPLGGRHTHHFWRLLNDLGIPHATLLDLDLGRAGGGAGRLRTAVKNLEALQVDALVNLPDLSSSDDITDELNSDIIQLVAIIEALKRLGVFFSVALDLDMSLLNKFPDAYKVLEPGERGPGTADPFDAVLGSGQASNTDWHWRPVADDDRERKLDDLRWYRYLFTNRSKPGTHIKAMSRIPHADFDQAPPSLLELVERVRSAVQP